MLLSLTLVRDALCAERLRVSDNSAKASVKDTLEAVSQAFDHEDLDAFEGCFSESRRPSIRKKYAMMFVRDKCSMELLESHTVEMKKDSAEAAVRYKMAGPDGCSEVVSTVKLVKEDGRWLIDGESVVSRKPSSALNSSPGAFVPPERQQDAKWDPMNPDPSKVSPHLQHLIGDVGIRPGMGCSGGNCANGRCEVE